MVTESGSGDLLLMFVRQPAKATDATGVLCDDYKKLESSHILRLKALLLKHHSKQDITQTSYATILLLYHVFSIVDLISTRICSSSMECQLKASTLPNLQEYSTDGEEGDFSSGLLRATSVVVSMTSTTLFLFDIILDMNPYECIVLHG